MRIFDWMRNRLNITIEEGLMDQAKRYARKHSTSVSKLVEAYFRTLSRHQSEKNILDMVDALPKPSINTEDLKKEYYEGQSKKHGV